MTPSALRALIGRVLVPNVRGLNKATARYRVLGFGADTLRVQSIDGQQRSSISLVDLTIALDRGLITIEDSDAREISR